MSRLISHTLENVPHGCVCHGKAAPSDRCSRPVTASRVVSLAGHNARVGALRAIAQLR